jgi:glycerol-3-phosphate acyltransferase PlsY
VSYDPINPLPLILSSLTGYLLGSIPAAYILVRWKTRSDIRLAGSGNVGALNSLQVTGSRMIGLAVLAIDAAKGMLAVFTTGAMIHEGQAYAFAAGLMAVVGHNYPLWLRFRGGRGLATAAGVIMPLSWWVIGVWGLAWAPTFLLVRNVNVANAIATLLMILVAWVLPDSVLANAVDVDLVHHFRIFLTILFVIILSGHVKPLKEYLQHFKTS